MQKSHTLVQLLIGPNSIPRRILRRVPFLKPVFQRKYIRDRLRSTYGYTGKNDSSKLRVALILRNGDTQPRSSIFIRLLSPLTDPSVANKISFRIFPQNTVKVGEGFDVCIVQRTVYDDLATAKKLVGSLAKSDTRLVVDSDDGFNAIDPSHPEHNVHQQRLDSFNYLLEQADEVWFSTDELVRTHPELGDKAIVVPNGLDSRIWQGKKPVPSKDSPIQLVYMGTATHNADFDMIVPALEAIAAKHPGSFDLNIIGVSDDLPQKPWIRRLIPEKGTMYLNFVPWFVEHSSFDVGLAPLVDNTFNRCKSDVKCLDYFAVGVVPMVSDITPYKSKELNGSIIRVKNTQEAWEEALAELIADRQLSRSRLGKMVAKGQEYLWSKRSSDVIGQLLLERLEALSAKNK